MIGRPKYGTVGLVSLPGFVLFEMLSPLVEFSGYLLLPFLYWSGLFDRSYAATLLTLSLLYAVFVSMLAVLLDDIAFRRFHRVTDVVVLLGATILENFGYRQLTVWWRVRAFSDFWRGDLSWGVMERRGVGTV
jgi:hypothetical protein